MFTITSTVNRIDYLCRLFNTEIITHKLAIGIRYRYCLLGYELYKYKNSKKQILRAQVVICCSLYNCSICERASVTVGRDLGSKIRQSRISNLRDGH